MVVCELLDIEKYYIYFIYILKDGWFYVDFNGKKFFIDRGSFSFSNGEVIIVFNVIFNIIYGILGEDGFLVVYWELFGIF